MNPSGPEPALTESSPVAAGRYADAPDLRIFIFALFFIFGGITSLNDVVIPKLKGLFTLGYGEVMLVQSAFFAAYFIFALPAAALVRRVGYMRSAFVGLVLMTAGCLLFIPASLSSVFGTFLVALFVLATGVTVIQVVANPLISLLGPPATAPSRLTFAQAFNALGTTIFPYVGSILILGEISKIDPSKLAPVALARFRVASTHIIVSTYLGLAAALIVVAAIVWLRRNRLHEVQDADPSIFGHPFALLKQKRFGLGALCIFLYVGAEVAIGSLIVGYLMQNNVWGVGAEEAGEHVIYYWGGAMAGRFVGAYVLKLSSPGVVLACAASAAIALLAVSSQSTGIVAGWALLSIGLFNSIMFPTIFSLASEGLGSRASEGSGIICMAIVGGAVIPQITGRVADWTQSLQVALAVPAICYAGILSYGIYARRPRPTTSVGERSRAVPPPSGAK